MSVYGEEVYGEEALAAGRLGGAEAARSCACVTPGRGLPFW